MILLLVMFSYCLFFQTLDDAGLSIASGCEGKPEIYCRSRGLTRAFAQILHFNFEKARTLNRFAPSLFTFFSVQLLARGIFTVMYSRTRGRRLIVIDSVLSGAYFFYTFFPLTLLYYWWFERP